MQAHLLRLSVYFVCFCIICKLFIFAYINSKRQFLNYLLFHYQMRVCNYLYLIWLGSFPISEQSFPKVFFDRVRIDL